MYTTPVVVVIVLWKPRQYNIIMICASIAALRSRESIIFVESGHVFVENVENLLFAPYICLRNIMSQVYIFIYIIILYINHGICGAFVIEIMEYIVH